MAVEFEVDGTRYAAVPVEDLVAPYRSADLAEALSPYVAAAPVTKHGDPGRKGGYPHRGTAGAKRHAEKFGPKKRSGSGKGKASSANKRKFTAEDRRKMAAKGQALPNGSFPIDDARTLRNAIRLSGRGKLPAATVRAHIIRRAKALGLTDQLPDKWKVGKSAEQPDHLEPASAVVKSEAHRRYTLGPLYLPDTLDAHAEHTDADELQKAVWGLVRKGDRSLRLQHDTSIVAGEIVEILAWPYPVTADLHVPGQLNKAAGREPVTFPPGTVYMGVVWEPWAWPLVLKGKVRGYSMGGTAKRVEVDIPAAKSASAVLSHALADSLLKHLAGKHDQKTHGGGRGRRGGGGADGGSEDAPAGRVSPYSAVDRARIERGDHPDHPLPAGKYPAGDPRNDPAYEAETKRIDAAIKTALDNGQDTESLHSRARPDGTREWSPERMAEHHRIVDQIMADNAAVPNERKAFLVGGPSGAGKSTFLRQHGGRLGIETDERGNPTNALVVNPDDVKSILLNGRDRNGKPLVGDVPGLKRGEMAALVHEESSIISSMLAERALAEGRNMVFDVTLASGASVKRKYLDPARAEGYSVSAAFVDGSITTSLHRAGLRHKQPNRETAERGMNGRYVPYDIVNKQAAPPGALAADGSPAKSTNRLAYDQLVADGVLDSAMRMDNVTGEFVTDIE